LQRSEERYRALFDRSLDGIFLHDFEGNFIDANPAMKELIGYDKNEAPVLQFSSLLTGDQLSKVWNVVNKAKETGFMNEMSEFRVKRKDGGFVDLEVISSVIYRDGKPYAMQGIARDITERKKAEETIKESEQRYKALFDRSNDCVYIFNFEGNIIDANPALLQLLGYSKEEMLSLNFASLLSENQLIQVLDALEEVRKTGFMKKIEEYHLRRKDGTFVDMEITASIINREGKPSAIQSIAKDVTERKKAQQALQESEERYRDLYENAPIAYFSARIPDTSIIRCNKAALKLTGYDRDKALNMIVFDFYSDIAEDRAKAYDLYNRLLTGESIRDEEVRMKHKNGHHLWVSYSVEPVKDESGTVIESRSMAVDISVRKHLQLQLNESKKMEAIATLAGGVAHQFNNALSVIKGNVDLMRMGLVQGDDIKDCITKMSESVIKMTRLTDQLLAYAKGGKYQVEVISCKDFFMDTLALIQHTIKPSIRIETDLGNNNLDIQADRTQMQMMLSAILSNASEAIEDKGCIRISCKKKSITKAAAREYQGLNPGAYAHVVIMDSGGGMDEQALSRIFEPFYSTKLQGRGLAMAAVYGIINTTMVDGYPLNPRNTRERPWAYCFPSLIKNYKYVLPYFTFCHTRLPEHDEPLPAVQV